MLMNCLDKPLTLYYRPKRLNLHFRINLNHINFSKHPQSTHIDRRDRKLTKYNSNSF